MPSQRIRYYTQAAALIALAVVIRRLTFPQSFGGLNLGGLPIILSGFVLGPWGGAMVGAVSDCIGILINNNGFTPLLTLTSALTGWLPAMVLMAFPQPWRIHPLCLGLSVAVGQFTTKVLLVPWFMEVSGMIHGTLTPFMTRNAIMESWHVPLYTILLLPLLRSYQLALGRPPAVLVAPMEGG